MDCLGLLSVSQAATLITSPCILKDPRIIMGGRTVSSLNIYEAPANCWGGVSSRWLGSP